MSWVKTGASAWKGHNLVIAPGDFNGEGRDDLVSRKPDGILWFAPG
ncbi:hypothetical protein [Arthrobacter crystallopoietes]|nr:hypothetical protein [Arthrobacter crystallopoietes]